MIKFDEPLDQEGYQKERLDRLMNTIHIISNWMALPLFFVFWICDLIYAPQYKFLFLGLRTLILPLHVAIYFIKPKVHKLVQGEWIALAMIGTYSSIINAMIFLVKDSASPYYAGLNLIAIGSITFMPGRLYFFGLANLIIYLPYFACSAIPSLNANFTTTLANWFFISGTVLITALVRLFNEKVQIKEFNSRQLLNQEIINRDAIIEKKTEEGMRLEKLSSQFSPQVIEAIKKEGIEYFSKTTRGPICAIFIDIVSSTDRLRRLDHQRFALIVESFMEDCLQILLKYDLTIDKFYGDGVLAFSNSPIKRVDYIMRTCRAAVEIRETINEKQDFYSKNWQNDFEITMGIAAGFATVGFFGNKSYIKQYSAIGEPMALAQRLSSFAKPGQICMDAFSADTLSDSEFSKKFLGRHELKGFDGERLHIYELEEYMHKNTDPTSQDLLCPQCSSKNLFVDEIDGIYNFRCRDCGSTVDNTNTLHDAA